MPKRPTGSANAVLQPGATRVQREGHEILTAGGFIFQRRTGHGSNLYHHPDGRTETVHGTPSNPEGQLDRLRRAAAQTKGTEVTTTPAANPVALYVSMADSFLLKQPKDKLEQRARQSALAGWVKRVLERHGPLPSSDLMAAGKQMGFTDRQLKMARGEAGVLAYSPPGSGRGRGRGGHIVYAALPHQLPEGVALFGRPRVEHTNGVASVRDELLEGTTRTPEEQGFVERGLKIMAEEAPSTPAVNDSEKRDAPTVTTDASNSDVAAAALMLLESLGVKKPGDEAREALAFLDGRLAAIQDVLAEAREALTTAARSLD